jgi:hypothetical protein
MQCGACLTCVDCVCRFSPCHTVTFVVWRTGTTVNRGRSPCGEDPVSTVRSRPWQRDRPGETTSLIAVHSVASTSRAPTMLRCSDRVHEAVNIRNHDLPLHISLGPSPIHLPRVAGRVQPVGRDISPTTSFGPPSTVGLDGGPNSAQKIARKRVAIGVGGLSPP